MARLETVKIEREGQTVIINKSDYDPEKHNLVGEKSSRPKTVSADSSNSEDKPRRKPGRPPKGE